MPSQDVGGVPPYPNPPPGISRRDHLATVEASIRYWEAIEARAAKTNNPAMLRIAAGLRASYEEARVDLLKAVNGGADQESASD